MFEDLFGGSCVSYATKEIHFDFYAGDIISGLYNFHFLKINENNILNHVLTVSDSDVTSKIFKDVRGEIERFYVNVPENLGLVSTDDDNFYDNKQLIIAISKRKDIEEIVFNANLMIILENFTGSSNRDIFNKIYKIVNDASKL